MSLHISVFGFKGSRQNFCHPSIRISRAADPDLKPPENRTQIRIQLFRRRKKRPGYDSKLEQYIFYRNIYLLNMFYFV